MEPPLFFPSQKASFGNARTAHYNAVQCNLSRGLHGQLRCIYCLSLSDPLTVWLGNPPLVLYGSVLQPLAIHNIYTHFIILSVNVYAQWTTEFLTLHQKKLEWFSQQSLKSLPQDWTHIVCERWVKPLPSRPTWLPCCPWSQGTGSSLHSKTLFSQVFGQVPASWWEP